MKLSHDNLALTITHMGAATHALLASSQCGKVLAAVSDAVYLLTASRELLWLASGGAPMHRRCLKTSTPLPRPAVGAAFHVHDRYLKIEPGFVFDSTAALLWQPPRLHRDDMIEIGEIPARVRALSSSLDLSQARGLGHFIPDILYGESGSAIATEDVVLAHAKPIVLDIADACRSQDTKRIAFCADALIGLGGGLTPSGDDFVGGLLFGIRVLLAAYPDSGLPDAAIIGETHRARTHPISFALLSDLASGHAIEPLHHIINGIICGEPLESIHLAILRLIQIGHSTGWDVLTGLFAGLLVTDYWGEAFGVRDLPQGATFLQDVSP